VGEIPAAYQRWGKQLPHSFLVLGGEMACKNCEALEQNIEELRLEYRRKRRALTERIRLLTAEVTRQLENEFAVEQRRRDDSNVSH
jgi:hypothetical protein